jgi:hypothetical protein
MLLGTLRLRMVLARSSIDMSLYWLTPASEITQSQEHVMAERQSDPSAHKTHTILKPARSQAVVKCLLHPRQCQKACNC